MRRRRTLRRLIVVGVVAVIAAGAASAWLASNLLQVGPDHEVALEIEPGAPVSRILGDLHRIGLIPSPRAARAYLLVEGRGRAPHFGRYRFPPRQ